ncbi:MAG: NADH-quinone oxidoreductase subunit L, partial [Elusimicrobia bacterium]|nr:NADH-quinone oxidoreductase subunit L [Elusimicrobiota bacterium]
IGIILLWRGAGTFDIQEIIAFARDGGFDEGYLTVAMLFLFGGAVGKSAQFPLHVWLPDAMEGPTPGSALIHAATMVAAGIFVVARLYFIFLAAPDAMLAAAWIGCITAFMAAAMALVSYDIKRVLAFSTVSQLGFMMCALEVGGYTAGLFHLTTHAFFKALLFLGAGSVIHAVHTNDMRLMGGLSKKMPITFVTMGAAILAISGIPGTSGYYSKDMILANIYYANQPIFWIMLGTALMTAFYMSRLFILTFWGDDRDHEKHHHAHESPFLITGPLVLLAFLALVSGYLLNRNELVYRLLAKPTIAAAHAPAHAEAEHAAPAGHAASAADHAVPAEAHAAPAHEGGAAEHHEGHLPHWLHLALPFLVLGSIGFAFALYKGPGYALADGLKSAFAPAFRVLDQRWFLDDAFDLLVVFCDKVAAAAFWIDANVVDRVFVDGWGLLTRVFAEISNLVDALFVDRTVDGFGGLSLDLGVGLRGLVKEGQVQEYLMYVAIAFSLAATLILTR